MTNKDIPLGIDVDNPWEYYGTDNIEKIPKHLRKKAKQYTNRQINSPISWQAGRIQNKRKCGLGGSNGNKS